jgi:hypothetical protein
LGALFGAHKKKVAQEASTLSGSLPAWRELVYETVTAYNAGQIDANAAVGYIEQAKALYYQQVAQIMRGKVPAGGVGAAGYTGQYGKFAPIDPCNGACYIGYYYIEPEAQIVESALRSGQDVTVTLYPVSIRNGDTVQGLSLTISKPLLGGVLPPELQALIPASIRQHALLFGLLALGGLVAVKRL